MKNLKFKSTCTFAFKLTLALGLTLAPTLNFIHATPTAQGPVPPEPAPTFEVDPQGKRQIFDFKLTPTPISNPNLRFSQFAKQKLLLFYFSASCPHCQHAAPHVQKLADELAAKGFKTIGIAIKNNTADEVRSFIIDYKFNVPVFQDESKDIGEKYGTGSIPLLFMINEKGEYIRHKSFEVTQTPTHVRNEAAKFSGK